MFYLIALLEGFTTLAVEIIAIRLATPLVGSSIVLTSVFLGVILLALSSGYYMGGIVASRFPAQQLYKILTAYLLSSGIFYGMLTFSYEQHLLEYFLNTTNNYILTLFLVATLLFFLPVFIASQTIPLLTELIPEKSKGKAAGSMLFASTIGSFLGSIGTSVWLFERLGVAKTAVITSCILLVCATVLLRKLNKKRSIILFIITLIYAAYQLDVSQKAYEKIHGLVYHHDSAYQEIIIRDGPWLDNQPARYFHANRAFSSGIFKATKESPFDYLVAMMGLTNQIKPKKILVIGTAGFTYPYQLAKLPYVEQIDAVDIDPSVKKIAEEHFLEEPLSPKITFIPNSARYVLHQAKKQGITYDLILIDAYNGKTLPDELTTTEFFSDLQTLASADHIFYNFILDTKLRSDLSKNLLSSVRAVFGDVWTSNVSYKADHLFDNFIVSATQANNNFQQYTPTGTAYTDDRRSTELDLVSMRRGGQKNGF